MIKSAITTLSFFPNPHPGAQFFEIAGKKPELAKRNADQQHGQGPDKRDKEYINKCPQPALFYWQPVHYLLASQAGKAAPDGKCAEDKQQLPAAHFPFCF